MCSEKSLTAAGVGRTERLCSSWHFVMTFVIYLARCSVIVRTLPWPIGALGPRNATLILVHSLRDTISCYERGGN